MPADVVNTTDTWPYRFAALKGSTPLDALVGVKHVCYATSNTTRRYGCPYGTANV